jgi:MFS family permease
MEDAQQGFSPLERRTLRVLASAQVVAGIGFFVGIAVLSLLGRELSGTAALAGLPPALGIASSALAAPPISALMDRFGRRPGLVACFGIAAAGSAVIVIAAAEGSFPLLCAGSLGFGIGNTAILLARYAGADLSPPERRARAISAVLLATAVGAVLGPNLVGVTAGLATALGTSALGGPFIVSTAGYLIAAALLAALLRPDPLLVAQQNALDAAGGRGPDPDRVRPPWAPLALIALATLVAINVAMIAIMTMTPLHLADGGGSLEIVGLVISLHLGAMFLPSPLTGWLSDRYGRLPIIGAGAITLLAAGMLSAVAGPHAFAVVAVALVLLGLGWNLGLVSASALLVDATPEPDRPRAQGFADLAMSFAGGTASLGSGLVLEHAGFATLGLIGAGVGIALVLTTVGARRLATA